MKNYALIVHLVWALTAAGAWWLGSRHNAPDASFPQQPSRGGLSAAGALSSHHERHPDKMLQSSSAGADDGVAWLRPRLSVDGILSPENMATAVAEAMHDPDPVRGLRHFTQLLESLTPENAAAALQVLRVDSGSRGSSPWLSMLCAAWGARAAPGRWICCLDDGSAARP
jgi:hypothetical protein